MMQNIQDEPLCSVPPHNESVLPMTQNESDGGEKITAQNCSLRNKWQPVIWRKKAALLIAVTQESVVLPAAFSKEQAECRANFSSKGKKNILLFKHTLAK